MHAHRKIQAFGVTHVRCVKPVRDHYCKIPNSDI